MPRGARPPHNVAAGHHGVSLLDAPAWHARAECARRGLGIALFFPASADPHRWDQQALGACAACTVRAECLAWAVEQGEQGIWAGTDEHVRARIRRRHGGG